MDIDILVWGRLNPKILAKALRQKPWRGKYMVIQAPDTHCGVG